MVAFFDLCCVRAEQARCHCGPAGLYSFSIERGSPGSDETGLLPALNNTFLLVSQFSSTLRGGAHEY